jgi:hydroxymethylglutaryl-CoA reductase (NADPH)
MASNEDRIGKFLRRLLQRRSALEIVQTLARDDRAVPARVPGGSSASPDSLEQRWQLLRIPESSRRALYDLSVSLEPYEKNIENCIGTVQVPVGLAGPLRVRGMFATGDFYVPLATTEATLVASYSRGAQAITEAGGCVSILLHEGMRRTPGFAFKSITEAGMFAIWCMENRAALHAAAGATTRHGELTDLGIAIEGNHVYLIRSLSPATHPGRTW